MEVRTPKSLLREKALAARRDESPRSKQREDAARTRAIIASESFRKAPVILSYYALIDEPETARVIEKALAGGKQVALPRCHPQARTMEWRLIGSLADAEPGLYRIPEPVEGRTAPFKLSHLGADALALVPGLVFDRYGYRLGYGGGYYDRFLADFPGISLGLARESQMVESLEALGAIDRFDRPVQLIATEKGVRKAS